MSCFSHIMAFGFGWMETSFLDLSSANGTMPWSRDLMLRLWHSLQTWHKNIVQSWQKATTGSSPWHSWKHWRNNCFLSAFRTYDLRLHLHLLQTLFTVGMMTRQILGLLEQLITHWTTEIISSHLYIFSSHHHWNEYMYVDHCMNNSTS